MLLTCYNGCDRNGNSTKCTYIENKIRKKNENFHQKTGKLPLHVVHPRNSVLD